MSHFNSSAYYLVTMKILSALLVCFACVLNASQFFSSDALEESLNVPAAGCAVGTLFSTNDIDARVNGNYSRVSTGTCFAIGKRCLLSHKCNFSMFNCKLLFVCMS